MGGARRPGYDAAETVNATGHGDGRRRGLRRRLRRWLQTAPAWLTSSAVHLAVFGVLMLIPYRIPTSLRAIVVETRLTEETPPPDFARLLESDYDPDTAFFDAAGRPQAHAPNAGTDAALSAAPEPKQSELPPAVGLVRLGDADLSVRLPPPQRLDVAVTVRGEELAIVAGQGEAMDQITREILVRLRKRPVLVIWMFDESRSMFDERQDIKRRFVKVYEELAAHPETGNRALLSAVVGFGKDVHFLSPRPTDDTELLREQIDRVPVDPSGQEWPCKHLIAVAQRYAGFSRRGGRDVMIVLLTDESGQRSPDGLTPLDGALVEEAIHALQEARMAVYVIGRQAAFGFPFVPVLYRDPETGSTRWVRITRGPETPGIECLQTNGLSHSRPAIASGFGPWELVRITRETGGIYFLIPAEESGRQRDYQYDPFVMKNYLPHYGPRLQYAEAVAKSPLRRRLVEVFRSTADVAVPLSFAGHPERFRQQAVAAAAAARRQRARLRQAYEALRAVADDYAAETSLRWRAAFDLAVAQLFSYQIRLYQYERMLAELASDPPRPDRTVTLRPGESLHWRVRICRASEKSWVSREELEPVQQMAKELYASVQRRHQGTPWAKLAEIELEQGFSTRLVPVVSRPSTASGRSEPVPEL